MKLVENREEQFKASGTYVIQDKIYNGYPLWKHESKNRYIWFDKQLSRWLVGETDGKGGKKTLLTVALLQDLVFHFSRISAILSFS